jgi:hypothetical protein
MSATLFAVYDEHTQEIDRVYEAQRDAPTFAVTCGLES